MRAIFRRLFSALLALLFCIVTIYAQARKQGIDTTKLAPPVCSAGHWDAYLNSVWHELCQTGRYGSGTDFSNSPDGRCPVLVDPLPASFLKEILTREPYRTRLVETGVSLLNVKIYEDLVIQGGTLPGELAFQCVTATIRIQNADIEGSVYFFGSEHVNIEISNSHVHGTFRTFAIRADSLNLSHSVIDRGVFIEKYEIDPSARGRIYLSDSRTPTLNVAKSKFRGLHVERATIENVTLMENSINYVTLVDARISNSLTVQHLTVENLSDKHLASYDGSALSLDDAHLGGSLRISNACLSQISAPGVLISGELALESSDDGLARNDACVGSRGIWTKQSMFTLSGASIGRIDMTSLYNWPAYIGLSNAKIEGFVPDRNSYVMPDEVNESVPLWKRIAAPHVSEQSAWFNAWLDKTILNSPNGQVYDPTAVQQVINFLQKTGDYTALDKIYIRGKNEELYQACSNLSAFSTCLYLAAASLVGYGRRLIFAMLLSIGFVVIGAFIFRRTETAYRAKIPLSWAYSFDMFIPLVKLRDRHYKDIDFTSRVRYYLYVHKLAGWILGTFIVASMVALTK